MRWKAVADVLGLSVAEKNRIQAEKASFIDRMEEVFDIWFRDDDKISNRRHYPISWYGLNELLIDSQVSTIAKEYFKFLDGCDDDLSG